MSAREPRSETELDHRVVVRTGTDRYRTRLEVRGHVFAADEPAELGGTDLGPAPYDLLCAALGACTTITLRMYADRKSWALTEVEAKVAYERRQEGADTAEDHFTVELCFEGDLDETQRARLLEIAGRCPVHKSLVRGAKVEIVSA